MIDSMKRQRAEKTGQKQEDMRNKVLCAMLISIK